MNSANDNVEVIKAGVIGHPIAHSLSPVIHRYWLAEHGIAGTYETFDVKEDALEDFLKNMAKHGLAGVNVTLPHKERTLSLVDHAGKVEHVIGAVNTIYVTPEGKLDGNNTDYYGFYKNLKEGAPEFDFTAGAAVVLGAGGAARAVVAALLALCDVPKVILTNRSRERAEALADAMHQNLPKSKGRVIVVDWEDRETALRGANLLVNTTALGMKGKPALELSLKNLPATALVTDIVYNPLETDLLKQAKTRGNLTVDGLGMLLHQAVLGFHKWYGVEPEVTPELRAHVLEELAEREKR